MVTKSKSELLSWLENAAGQEKIEILNQLAGHYWDLPPNERIAFAEQAVDLARKYHDDKSKAESYNHLGIAYNNLGDSQKSIEFFLDALQIVEQINDKNGIAISYRNLGQANFYLDNFDKALGYFQKAIKLQEELGQVTDISQVSILVGNVKAKTAKYDEALDYYFKALAIKEKINDKNGISQIYNNLGNIYFETGHNDKALKYRLKALHIVRELDDKWGIANSAHNIAEQYLNNKEPEKAHPYLLESQKLAEALDNKGLIRDNLYLFSLYYELREDYQKALDYQRDYSELTKTLFSEELSKKITEMQTKYETEKLEEAVAERTQELQHSYRELALLNRVIAAASATLEPQSVLEITCRELALAFDLPQAAAALLNEERTASVVVAEYLAEGYPSALDVVNPIEANPATQYVLEHKAPLAIADAQHDPRMEAIHEVMRQRGTVSMLILPLMARGQVVGTLGLAAVERREFSGEEIDLAANAAAAAAQSLENARLYQSEQRRRLEAELLREAAQAMNTSLEIDEILRLILAQLKHALAYTAASVLILREDTIPELVVGSGYTDEPLTSREAQGLLRSSPILRQMALDLQPVVSADVRELEGWVFVPGAEHVRAWLGVPLVVRGRMIGALMVDSEQPDFFGEADVQIIQALAQLAAQAIENARLFSQANRRLRRLGALHTIDRTISASFDINLTADMFLDQVLTQLEVDAADLLLFDPLLQTLECAGGKGFRTSALEHPHLRLGQGLAGQVALQREIKHIPDLQEEEEVFLTSPNLSGEEFSAYYGIPLIAKGMLKGVLEIFHRAPLSTDDEWLIFLNALAGQAAIAIDNASMFTDLQRSNLELGMAYDSTLEGLAKALELKDVETEGHSRRVVDLTMQLASRMRINRKRLIHIRRGALLHDIGKMGVPDSILNKPGPLNDEEWAIMRQHPDFANEMLQQINYLRPALDIPYCHHEKWDGTGYPRGLKGEHIPLAARIFAVVDVWDALLSDRPYRDAWPEEEVLAYLKKQSGKHFDPVVLKKFLEIVINT